MARLGDTVLYRNKDGVDIVAIVTELFDDDTAYLTRLPSPTQTGDPNTTSYRIARDASDEPARQTWRDRDDPGA